MATFYVAFAPPPNNTPPGRSSGAGRGGEAAARRSDRLTFGPTRAAAAHQEDLGRWDRRRLSEPRFLRRRVGPKCARSWLASEPKRRRLSEACPGKPPLSWLTRSK